MYPLVNEKYNIIFFWSYKCGCTFIKYLFYNEINKKNYSTNYIKFLTAFNILYNNINNKQLRLYTKIYVCRNPYIRIVSCFLDKYINNYFSILFNTNIAFKNFFTKNKIKSTFKEFINLVYEKLVLKKFNLIEYNHIEEQFNNTFYFDKIFKLEDINLNDNFYDYLNTLVPSLTCKNEKMIFKNYTNTQTSTMYIDNAYNLEYQELLHLKKNNALPNYKCFYNDEIIEKVNEIYKNDFKILKMFNIEYNDSFKPDKVLILN